jgi:hypothetical protein
VHVCPAAVNPQAEEDCHMNRYTLITAAVGVAVLMAGPAFSQDSSKRVLRATGDGFPIHVTYYPAAREGAPAGGPSATSRMPHLTGSLFQSLLRHGTSRLLAQPMRLFLPFGEISGHIRFEPVHFLTIDLNRNLNVHGTLLGDFRVPIRTCGRTHAHTPSRVLNYTSAPPRIGDCTPTRSGAACWGES